MFRFATLPRSLGDLASECVDLLSGRFVSFAERIEMVEVPRTLLREMGIEGSDPIGERLQGFVFKGADLRAALRDLLVIGAVALVHQRVDGFRFRDQAAAAADKAELANVRDRELRAEKTWRGLAEQARKVKIDRERALGEREAKRLAEEAATQSGAAPEAA